MAANTTLKDRIRDTLGRDALMLLAASLKSYRTYFVLTNIAKSNGTGQPHNVQTYDEHLDKGDNAALKQALDTTARHYARTRREIVLHAMPDDIRAGLETLFLEDYDDADAGDSHDDSSHTARALAANTALQSYLRDLQPHLDPAQCKRFAKHLSEYLFGQMSDDQRRDTTPALIERHILNMGFITLARADYRKAVSFVIRYPPFFKNESDVLETILYRYVDEEIVHATTERTHDRAQRLKEEIRAIYQKVNDSDT